MSPEGSIRAEHIWKRFRPDRTHALIVQEYQRLRARMGGPPVNWQWALRDVSLVAEPGESIGLVGDNGSGKSTLLKIVCGVMQQYAGRLDVHGRIGALIEVKAGIQPELTGRENIALYGTLLGLSRQEVMGRFDEIVAFAQLEHAIDRQVKFYSSGMQMRLGFSVAAFLEPAILLVDEVLAVGDQQFQQRCLERMRYVLAQGTTVVYVSHDLASVGAICERVIWLQRGVVAGEGSARDIIAAYRRGIEERTDPDVVGSVVALRQISATNPASATILTDEPLDVTMRIESQERRRARMYLGISEGTADPILVFRIQGTIESGPNDLSFRIDRLPLPRGRYVLWAGVFDHTNWNEELIPWQSLTEFDVYGPDLDESPPAVVRRAPVYTSSDWELVPAVDVPSVRRSADGGT